MTEEMLNQSKSLAMTGFEPIGGGGVSARSKGLSPIGIFKNKRNTEQFKSSLKLFVPNKKSKVAFTLAEVFSTHFKNNRKSAFTLAEVLITLGIIGVVAALTMPILMQNYNKKVTETRLKKFYSTMNQTVERLKVDYGDLKDWDYTVDNLWQEGEETTNGHLTDQSEIIAAKFDEYFGKYIEFVDKKKVEVRGKEGYLFYFKDGSAIMPAWYNNFDYEYFPKNPEKCLKNSSENRYGICSFAFQFYTYDPTKDLKGFFPYITGLDRRVNFTKEKMYNHSSRGCRNGGNYCGLIIMLNNWTVPDDYPKKLAY